ncbi:radical SAM/SPASM domain-containing protein [Candidatus Margulisiibacteriota bacterium]
MRLLSLFNNINRLMYYCRVRLKYLTIKKLINLILTEYFYFKKQIFLKSYPYELIIDPTNACQLKCPICYTGRNKSGREKGVMKFSPFKEIIDELSPYALHVFLHNWGEPFLHKEILKFIHYAHNANLATTISSNLSFPLKNNQIEEIIDSGLDTLVISADGITPGVYGEYRIGGNFEQVLANIKLLAQKKREKKSKTPHLEWQFLVMRHNEHQIAKVEKFAKGLGINSVVLGNICFLHNETDLKIIEKWLPTNKSFVNKKWHDKCDNLIKGCWWLWRAVVINWDGRVTPCCYLDNSTSDFASFNRPFKDIWNNSYYTSARNLFTKRKINSTINTICNNCNAATQL